MANPRQRRKARSSSHRPVSHSGRAKKLLKKTPPIRGPKILQDSWDKHKTVKQNYAALGLVHTLNPLASGGVEHDPTEITTEPTTSPIYPSAVSTLTSSTNHIPKGYGKIIRDAEGNVVRVELPEDSEDDDQDQGHPSDDEMRDPEVDKLVLSKWVTGLGGGRGAGAIAAKSLEQFSSLSASSTSGPRHASNLETLYLARLVRRHGEDVETMARDRRLNPEQRTSGELRRGIRRAGGVISLGSVEF